MRNTKLKVQSNFDDFFKKNQSNFLSLSLSAVRSASSASPPSWPCPLQPPLFFLSHILFLSFCPISPPSGSGGVGGQRHHQLQATGYPAAGYPCQPVRLSHREGRGKDKGDQRGERAERLTSTPSSPRPQTGPNTET